MTRILPFSIGCALLIACLGCTPALSDTEAPDDGETRAIMGRLLESVRILVPRSVGEGRLDDPQAKEEILGAAASLEGDAAFLAEHAKSLGGGAVFLGRSLDRGAQEIRANIEHGRYERAQYLIRRMVQSCVGCHARLPAENDSPRAEDFVSGDTLRSLPAEQRATLQVATRRFDDALSTLEVLLLDPSVHPALLLGPLEDYMTISVRVKGDYQRPAVFLQKFAARKDVWKQLRAEAEAWSKALPELEQRSVGPPRLDTARSLIEEAQRMSFFRGERSGLANEIAASAVLHRYLTEENHAPRDVAEAYYLLGVTESRIERDYWVTPADYFLELAIRGAPAEPFAEKAYGLLEEQLLLSYEGSSVESLPELHTRRLGQLRKLIDDAGAAARSG